MQAVKPVAAIVVLALLGWWLFAPAQPAAVDGKVRLTFGTFGNPEQVAVYREIVAMFEKRHPGITVDLRTPSSGGYVEKLRTEMAGRVAPDVTWVDVGSFYSFSDKQVFRPLDEFATADPEFRLDEYYPEIIRAFTHEGRFYALPKSSGSQILFYNMDHFDEAGIPYPNETWTWDDIVSASQALALVPGGGARPSRFALVNVDPFDFLLQNGASVLSPDGARCLLDTTATVRACNLFKDLTHRHHAVPTMSQMGAFGISAGGVTSGGRGGSSIGVFDLFSSGKVSMIITDLVLSLKYQSAPFRWDVTMQPRGLVAAGALNGAGYAMNARTKHPREAWQLIKFLAGPVVQELRARNGDSLPSLRAIATSPAFMNNPRKPSNRQAVIDQMLAARRPPYNPRWTRIALEANRMFEDFMSEESPLTVEDAAGRAQARIDRILAGEE